MHVENPLTILRQFVARMHENTVWFVEWLRMCYISWIRWLMHRSALANPLSDVHVRVRVKIIGD